MFVAKYEDVGHRGIQLAWAEVILGAGTLGAYQETGPRVWVDAQGPRRNLIVSGIYEGTASFGDFQMTSAGADDIYVMNLKVKDEGGW